MTAFKKHCSEEIKNAPFTFAQNMSVVMTDRSLNTFGYNTDARFDVDPLDGDTDTHSMYRIPEHCRERCHNCSVAASQSQHCVYGT